MKQKVLPQIIPLLLTGLTFIMLTGILFIFILFLNLFPIHDKIIPKLHFVDIVVGLTIYLKTSIDFAIFIGNLMHKYPGWKNRIAIETGTALGNALGTLLVLVIWTFFKEVPILLLIMVILASLVLLQMAESGLNDYFENPTFPNFIDNFLHGLLSALKKINSFFRPVLSRILPKVSFQEKGAKGFWTLVFFAFSIPFVLGLDDFAGYIPLFSIINVFGFATGVFLGHMVLNLALFTSPKITTSIVRQPAITAIGGLVFIGLSLWGFVEAFKALLLIVH